MANSQQQPSSPLESGDFEAAVVEGDSRGSVTNENLTTMLKSILGPPRINDPHESNEGTSSLNGEEESSEPGSGDADAFADGGGNSPERGVGENPEMTPNSQQPPSSQLESGDFEAAVEGDSRDSVNQGQDETSADAKWWFHELEPTWNLRLKELIAYKQEHGDCNVPRRFPENPQLGSWVGAQRSRYNGMKRGLPSRGMTEERAAILEGIGFVWTIKPRASWDERFHELEQFKKEKGHCNVSRTNVTLRNWLDSMKSKLRDVAEGKRTTLTDAQIIKLLEIGLSAAKRKQSASEHVVSSEPSHTQQTEPRPKRYKSENKGEEYA